MRRFLSLFQLFRNMGLRYTIFRIWYEVQLKTGLLKRRFPVNPPLKSFVSLESWRNQDVNFFFDPLQCKISPGYDLALLRQRVAALKENRLLFFGSSWYHVPDWLTNPDNGFHYDISKHWTEIPDLSQEAGDIKYVWEKSRFTFLYDLIRYDFYTKEDQSSGVFAEIESWINANPVNCGPNWRCSQEISLRVLNWTFALQYYKNSANLTGERFTVIMSSIYRQMQHVRENIRFSRIAVRNNHAITETLTLYLTGLLYPFFPESKAWKEDGGKWFEEEIAYQIYDDGTFLQFSMNYHRVVIQLFTWAIRLAEVNGERWNEIIYDRARKSLDFLSACQDEKTGWLPNHGNNDGALFFPLTNCSFRDFRPQLGALARILGKDLHYGRGDWEEEEEWLCGFQQKTGSEPVRNGKPALHVFPAGGYYIIRDQSTVTFLRCGSYKDRPFQADNLHLDIWVNGENILRDAGSYKYNTSEKWIRYFAGTASHNTVMLGNHDQMRKGPRFIWYDWINLAKGSQDRQSLSQTAQFRGFSALGPEIIHKRSVVKTENALHWVVEDWILNAPVGVAMHQIWHPSEGFLKKYSITSVTIAGDKLHAAETEGWYSGMYGQKEQALRLVFTTQERYIRTVISAIP